MENGPHGVPASVGRLGLADMRTGRTLHEGSEELSQINIERSGGANKACTVTGDFPSVRLAMCGGVAKW